jgi:hypothetical protein
MKAACADYLTLCGMDALGRTSDISASVSEVAPDDALVTRPGNLVRDQVLYLKPCL